MKYKLLPLLFILLLLKGADIMGQEWKFMPFRLQAGYSFSAFNAGDGHMIQLGVCRPSQYFDGGDGVLSTIPLMGQAFSVNAIGLFTDGKFHPGIKLGCEAQIFILSGKFECALLDKYVFLTPSIGLGVVTKLGVYAGYNICVNDSGKSGFQLSLHYNFIKLSSD